MRYETRSARTKDDFNGEPGDLPVNEHPGAWCGVIALPRILKGAEEMNAIELVEEAKKEFEATVRTVDVAASVIGAGDLFWFARGNRVYMLENTYHEISQTVEAARQSGVKLVLSRYFEDKRGLVIAYEGDLHDGKTVEILFCATDKEYALEMLKDVEA